MQTVMVSDNTIQSLLDKAKNGDAKAFGVLYEEYRARLAGLVHSRMGPGLQEHVEVNDVLQETFTRAFASLLKFEWQGEDSFIRWLGGIAENVLRKAASVPGSKLRVRVRGNVADSGVSPSRALRRDERMNRLQESLEKLTPAQREVQRLVRIEGLKLKEVASHTNRTVEAVQQLLLRGLRQLRKHFGDTESLHLPERQLDFGQEDFGQEKE